MSDSLVNSLVSGAAPGESRVAVIALGGNVLLRCGEPLEAGHQARRAGTRVVASSPELLVDELERAVVAEAEFFREYAARTYAARREDHR